METLKRELDTSGAILLGLGSILGTGVFVSLGLGAGIAGSLVVPALCLAAGLAICNGLSSARLAAAYPRSGGTYEFGIICIHPAVGFTAGWMFLLAKSASAATAALGLASYVSNLLGIPKSYFTTIFALLVVILLTLLVLGGLRRSNRVNLVIVSVTIITLFYFMIAGLPTTLRNGMENWLPFTVPGSESPVRSLLEATSILFVAYTGYGRIATMGEEIKDPARSIPRAILLTLFISLFLYLGVAIVAIGMIGPGGLARATRGSAAPLEVIARQFGWPGAHLPLVIGAVFAMIGVILNLLLGISRVVLAMGRRGDLPAACSTIREKTSSPVTAVLVTSALIIILVLAGDIRLTWYFSAFCVLIYYAITHWSALRLPETPRGMKNVAIVGLFGCVLLAFMVPAVFWITGLCMLIPGFILRVIFRKMNS
jgi:APA family basic amino acid/polyamine antiporter